MWEAYLLAKQMGVRPSELYDVDDPLARYCFDRAVITFGSVLEGEISKVKGRNEHDTEFKRQRVINKFLGVQQKFRDPASMIKKGT